MTPWMRSTAGALAIALLPMTGAAAQGAPLGTPMPGKLLGSAVEGSGGPRAFLEHQLSFERVVQARDATEGELRVVFADRGVDYPAPEIFLRAFKHERIMELWARSDEDSPFTLIKKYPVCALPGQLGPKQQMGDFQVPEGFYFIDGFNPRSSYHLSLRVSYPNLSDRMRGESLSLGGDIFVHGGCETVGCIPVENHNIKEIYWLAARAMDAGQRVIPIHIFPSRMDEASVRWLERTFQPEPRLLDFWRNLAEGYQYFEETRRVPWITVAQDGRYAVPAMDRLASKAPRPDTMGSATDSLGLATDSLGLATDSLGLATDSLGLATDTLGLATDRLGLATDSLGSATDTIVARPDSLRAVPQGAAGVPADTAAATDTLGSATDSLGSATDTIVVRPDSLRAVPEGAAGVPADTAAATDTTSRPVPHGGGRRN